MMFRIVRVGVLENESRIGEFVGDVGNVEWSSKDE